MAFSYGYLDILTPSLFHSNSQRVPDLCIFKAISIGMCTLTYSRGAIVGSSRLWFKLEWWLWYGDDNDVDSKDDEDKDDGEDEDDNVLMMATVMIKLVIAMVTMMVVMVMVMTTMMEYHTWWWWWWQEWWCNTLTSCFLCSNFETEQTPSWTAYYDHYHHKYVTFLLTILPS